MRKGRQKDYCLGKQQCENLGEAANVNPPFVVVSAVNLQDNDNDCPNRTHVQEIDQLQYRGKGALKDLPIILVLVCKFQ